MGLRLIESISEYFRKNTWHYKVQECDFKHTHPNGCTLLLWYIDTCIQSSKIDKVTMSTLNEYSIPTSHVNVKGLIGALDLKLNSIGDDYIVKGKGNTLPHPKHVLLLTWMEIHDFKAQKILHNLLLDIKARISRLETYLESLDDAGKSYTYRAFNLQLKDAMTFVELVGGILFGFED